MPSLFPKLYDVLMKPLEATRFKKVRSELVREAKGNVLEIGSGTGINFPYYHHATKVTAIEPNPLMSERGMERLKRASVPIEVVQVGAEALPFEDNTFDTVIATLVFCTIPDPVKALDEIRRVSKPGAALIFFEHVRLEQPSLGMLQDILNPLWAKVCDGCQLNRDTLGAIRQAGIEVVRVKSMYNKLFLSITGLNTK